MMSGDQSSKRSGRRLELPPVLRRRIIAAARAETPREACGVLVGTSRGESVVVTRIGAAENIDRRPASRYRLDPRDFLDAERRARRDGLEVVGFWHSHPRSGAEPSGTDRAAAWEGYSYLIVSRPEAREPELRSWRWVSGAAVEEKIVVAGDRPGDER